MIVTDTAPQILVLVIDKKGEITRMIDLSALSEDILTPEPFCAVDEDKNIFLYGDGAEFIHIPEGGEPEVVKLPSELGEEVKATGGAEPRFYSVKALDSGEFGCVLVAYRNGEFSRTALRLSCSPSTVGFVGDKLFYCNAEGAFCADESGSEKLFDWFDLGLDSGYVKYNVFFDEDNGVIFYRDEYNGKITSAALRRTGLSEYLSWHAKKYRNSSENATEIQTIKIVAAEPQSDDEKGSLASPFNDLKRNLSRFRRNNLQYETELTRISGSGSDAANALTRRMMAGEIPDLIAFSDGLSSNYFDPGTFIDLYSFMDADEAHGRDTFLPCVTSSFEDENQRLPYLTTKFGLSTIAGLRGEFSEPGWTLSEFLDYAEALPEDRLLTGLSMRDNDLPALALFDKLIPGVVDEFIDYDKKTCDFTGDFKRLLAVIKDARIGEDRAYDVYGFANGDIALKFGEMDRLLDYLFVIKAMYLAKEITAVGYPGEGSQIAIQPELQLAVPVGCANPDGGWRVITTHVDAEAEHELSLIEKGSVYAGMAPVRGFQCTWSATNAMLGFYEDMHLLSSVVEYTNSDGKRRFEMSGRVKWNYRYEPDPESDGVKAVSYDFEDQKIIDDEWESVKKSYQKGGATEITGETTIIDFDENDRKFLESAFNSKCHVISQDQVLIGIIREEAEEYFLGVKTLENAVDMVQNRVSTRINE